MSTEVHASYLCPDCGSAWGPPTGHAATARVCIPCLEGGRTPMGGATVKGLKFGPFGTLKPFVPAAGGKIPFDAIPADMRQMLLDYPTMAACVDLPEGFLEGLQQAKVDAVVESQKLADASAYATPTILPAISSALIEGLTREVLRWLETQLFPLMASQRITAPTASTASSPDPTPSPSPQPSTSSPSRDGSPSEESALPATTTPESSTIGTPISSRPSGE